VGKKPKVVFVRGFFIIYQIFSSKLAGNVLRVCAVAD